MCLNRFAFFFFFFNYLALGFSIISKEMDLKIGSINVRGLGDNQKRREIFNWLKARNSNFSVYFLTVPKTQHLSGRPNGDMKPY